MNHTASARFWQLFDRLPADVQSLARRNFELLKQDPSHPSLHFKALAGGRIRSVRVGLHHRALATPVEGGYHWFWIGTHADYDKLVG